MTQAEIATATAEIRAGWSHEEHQRREYFNPIEAFYYLAAIVLGADERTAYAVFRGNEEYYRRERERERNSP